MSGICHHMMFETDIIKELINKIELKNNDLFINVILNIIIVIVNVLQQIKVIIFLYLMIIRILPRCRIIHLIFLLQKYVFIHHHYIHI